MHQKVRLPLLGYSKPFVALFVVLAVMVSTFAVTLRTQQPASAATNNGINFQARLMSNTGGIVPDGYYNVEFKIYNALTSSGSSQGSCTGDANCLWTETYYDTNGVTAGNDFRVRVVNGYLTVSLGSRTAFPSTINWDQQLWITMNIGGTTQTATPTYDGEMSPRLQLTAVPYAFRAGQLASLAGSHTGVLQFAASLVQDSTITLPDPGASTATVCYQNSASCGFATGTTGSYIQNGTTIQSPGNFAIRSAAAGSVGGVIQGFNGQSVDLFDLQTWNGTSATTVVGVSNVGLLTASAGVTATGTIQLNATGSGATTIGNSGAGALTVASGAASSIAVTGNTLSLSGTNFSLNNLGVLSLAGGQTIDITTPAVATATALTVKPGASSGASSNGAALNLKGGDGSGTTNVTGGNVTVQGGDATGGSGTRIGGSASVDGGLGAVAANNGAVNIGSTNASAINIGHGNITTTVTGNTTLNPGSANTVTINSDLSTGARSTPALQIVQLNDATNNNTSNLLKLQNGDSSSTAAALQISNVSAGKSINITGHTTGTAIDISASNFTSGIGLNADASTLTSGSILAIGGANAGATAGFTGSLIVANPTRTLTSGSLTDSGNFLNLTRANTVNNAGSTFTVSGALANLQSNCTQTAGTCTDTANILNLNQQYANASGAVLNVAGAGTGNLGIFDATNTGANGVSIDVQSNSSTKYALSVTSNNGGTTGLYVRADGNVGIGTATPGASLDVNGTAKIATLGASTANSATVCRDTSTNQLTSCDGANTTGKPFLQGGNAFAATAVLGTTDANNLQIITGASGPNVRATFDQSNNLYLGNGITAAAPNNFAIQGTGSSTVSTAGATLTIQGGVGATSSTGSAGGVLKLLGGASGGSGNTVGGNVLIQGGAPTGTAASGSVIVRPQTNDSTSAFNVQTTLSNNMFTVDTLNGRVGIALGGSNTPASTLEVKGTLRLSGQTTENYITPNGGTVTSAINVVNFDPGQFNQVIAMGVPTGAHVDSRVISVFDGRNVAHQPSLAVFSQDQGSIIGLNWNGGSTTGLFESLGKITSGGSTSNVSFQSGDVAGGSGNSGTVWLQSGAIAGGSSNTTGTVFIISGDGSGTNASSGNVTIDSGAKTGIGTNGTINVGITNSTSVLIGRAGGTVTLQGGTTKLSSVGSSTANSATLCRDTSTTNITACDGTNTTGKPFLQGGNSFGATAMLGTADANDLEIITGGTAASNIRAYFDQSNHLYLGNGTSAAAPSNFGVLGTASSTAGTPGGNLSVTGGAGATSTTGSVGGQVTIQGGAGGGTGNNAGGQVTVQGGTAVNSGTGGLLQLFGGASAAAGTNGGVTLDAGSGATTPNGTINVGTANASTINIGSVGSTAKATAIHIGDTTSTSNTQTVVLGSAALNANNVTTIQGGNGAAGSTAGIQLNSPNIGLIGTNPNISTTGANTLTIQTGGAGNLTVDMGTANSGILALGDSNAATINIGRGGTNTAAINIGSNASAHTIVIGSTAGASATTIQAGTGNMLLQTNSASAAVQVKSNTNSTTAFQVQDSIGANLLNVDTTNSNLIANPGGEATFGTTWVGYQTGGSVAPATSAGQFYSGAAAVSVTTGTTNAAGGKNNIGVALTNGTQYVLSFWAKLNSGTMTDLQVGISKDGGTGTEQQCGSNMTLSTTTWTHYSCTVTPNASGTTGAYVFFRQQNTGTSRTFFIDNVGLTASTNTTAPSIKVGGNGPTTIFSLDQAAGVPTTTGLTALLGSMYYNTTSGHVQCYEDNGVGGAWGDCGNTTLQQAYGSSTGGTTPEIILDNTRKGVDIQDQTGGSLGNTVPLFSVRGVGTASTLGASLFTVNGAGQVGIKNGETTGTASLNYDLSFGQNSGATTRTIGVETQATPATNGNALTVSAGTGNTSGTGGQLTLQAGAGGSSGVGGAVLIQGGAAGGGTAAGGNITLQAGAKSGTAAAGTVIVKNSNDSLTAFNVQNAGGSSTLLDVDTINSFVGVGTAAPSRTLHVSVNTSSLSSPMILAEQLNASGDSGIEFKNTGSGGSFFIGQDTSNSNSFSINSYSSASTSPTTVAHVQSVGTNNAASATTIAQAYTSNTTAGNLLVAAVAWDNTTASSVTCSDNSGSNVWNTAFIKADNTLHDAIAICYAANVVGGADTVTATFNASAGGRYLVVHEYSGAAKVNPLDVTASNLNAGATGTDAITSTAATTTQNGDLIFGEVYNNSGSTTSITAGTGFTGRITQNTFLMTEDKVQASAASVAATYTFAAARNYLAGMATIKAATSIVDAFSGSLFTLSQSGAAVFKNSVDTSNSFQIQNAAATNTVFNVDALNGRVGINTTAPTADLSFGTGANRVINVVAQTTNNTAGNNLTVNSAAGLGTGQGGTLTLQAGSGGATGIGGTTTLQGGAGGATSGTGGQVNVTGGSGTGTGAASGAVVISTAAGVNGSGATAGGAGGNISISTGAGGAGTGSNSNGAQGGDLSLSANNGGNGTGTGTNGRGGNVSISAGANGTGGSGGSLTAGTVSINGGAAGGATAGGTVTIQGGAASATAGSSGGAISIQGMAGSSTGAGGAGGNITLQAGVANGTGNNAGGNVTLQAGSRTGTGTAGSVIVKNAADNTAIFQIQNTAGTSFFTADSTNKIINSTDHNVGTSSGARLFTDSFEENSFSLWDAGPTVVGTSTVSIDSSIKRNGSYSAKLAVGSGNDYYLAHINSTSGTIYARAYVYISAYSGSTDMNLFGVMADNVGHSLEADVQSGGSHFLELWDGSIGAGGQMCTTSTAVSSGTWHKIEIQGSTAAGATLKVYLDGIFAPFTAGGASCTAQTITNSLANFNEVRLGDDNLGNPNGNTFYVDDMEVDATATPTADSGSLNVQDSLHVGGSSSLGLTVVQASSDTGPVLQVQNSVGATQLAFDPSNTAAGLNVALNSGAELGSGTPTSWAAHGSATLTRDTNAAHVASGVASAAAATTGATQGVRNNVGTAMSANTTYVISFSIKVSVALTNANLSVVFSPTGTTSNNATCTTMSTSYGSISTSSFIKYTCSLLTTSTATTSSAYLAIFQADATARSIYVDNLAIVAQNSSGAQDTGDLKIGGATSQGLTLFTLDTFGGTPFTGSNASLAGSMYFDTSSGKIQCYDGSSWGACGAAPNGIITLTPEYTGAVLNGSGIGTMTSDFCANESGVLTVGTLCGTHDSRNFYKWTSPQTATLQEYDIYVTYKLPTTFKSFVDDNTITLTARSDGVSGSTAFVTFEVFKSTGSAITECGTETQVTTSDNTWQTVSSNGNENSTCGFAAGNNVIFKIRVKAKSNANAYVENLNFSYTNQ